MIKERNGKLAYHIRHKPENQLLQMRSKTNIKGEIKVMH